jgi:hypothetical protein
VEPKSQTEFFLIPQNTLPEGWKRYVEGCIDVLLFCEALAQAVNLAHFLEKFDEQ